MTIGRCSGTDSSSEGGESVKLFKVKFASAIRSCGSKYVDIGRSGSMSYLVLPIIGIVLVLSHIIYGGYSSESKLRRAQISDFGEIGESHLITASTSSDWYSTRSKGNNIHESSAVRAFHPMAYPQSLGR